MAVMVLFLHFEFCPANASLPYEIDDWQIKKPRFLCRNLSIPMGIQRTETWFSTWTNSTDQFSAVRVQKYCLMINVLFFLFTISTYLRIAIANKCPNALTFCMRIQWLQQRAFARSVVNELARMINKLLSSFSLNTILARLECLLTSTGN